MSATPASTGRNACRSSHVNLAAAAGDAARACGRSARTPPGRKCTPGRRRAFSVAAQALGVDPRRADQLERPRRAAALRDVRALEEHRARIDDGGVERGHVGRRHHPRQRRCRRSTCRATSPPSARPRARAPMPKCSLNSRASSPIVMPWRIGIGNCPTNDSKPGSSIGPSTATPPIGFGRSQTIDGHAVPRRGAQAVGHRVDVGVDARADVLQVDDEHVEAGEHLRRRLARVAVERIDRHAPLGVVARAPSRSCCPAGPTGSRAAGRRCAATVTPGAASSASTMCVNAAIDRRGVADDADAPAAEAGRGEQACGAERDGHRRIIVVAWKGASAGGGRACRRHFSCWC